MKKKESDSEANVFRHNENLKGKFSKRSGFELRIFRSGRFRIQNFSNNHILEKKYFPKTQFLSLIFIEKSDFDQKFTSEKKCSDSICFTENNKFSTFRADFKRHDFETSFSLKIRVWNEFLEKKIELWSEVFSYKLKSFWIESFSSRWISKNFFQ